MHLAQTEILQETPSWCGHLAFRKCLSLQQSFNLPCPHVLLIFFVTLRHSHHKKYLVCSEGSGFDMRGVCYIIKICREGAQKQVIALLFNKGKQKSFRPKRARTQLHIELYCFVYIFHVFNKKHEAHIIRALLSI